MFLGNAHLLACMDCLFDVLKQTDVTLQTGLLLQWSVEGRASSCATASFNRILSDREGDLC